MPPRRRIILSPTVRLLKKFKKTRLREEEALETSNEFARLWRGTNRNNPELRLARRAAYNHARGLYTDLRNASMLLADCLFKREAVTVKKKDDVDWVARLQEIYGALACVRVRGRQFEGGPFLFRTIANNHNLPTIEN